MSKESKKDGEGAAVDKYNVEAAEILATEAQRLPISEAAPIYEQLISTFPTAGKYWKLYVEAYMAANNDDAAKHLFSRCLLSCLQISLWHCYIRFIRKVNERKGVDGLEETKQAYDFMLSYVGTDIGSGPLWMEYIAFLKSRMATSPQEDSQRMTTVRKVYQKAIVTPTHQVEQLWKDYENFENSVSRQLAKGLVSEYQPKFNSARAVYRERKKYVDEIDWNMLAVPPSGSSKEEKQYMAWKNFLAFEKGNPQRIDSSSANKRIAFTFEQSLLYLYHYPDIWYDYATWHVRSGSIDSAVKVYQRAIKALPDSESLRYAYAELEESRGGIQMAKNIYEGLLAKNPSSTALAQIQFIRFLRRNEGMEAARKYFIDARKLENCTYHVYVASALIAFCVDKDPKFAHSVFETGLKRFMQEPGYILDYADFLCRVNDDRNVRALFERALNSLPPDESIEVWKRFVQFEQTYGDLASMLKVEQRKKEALSRTCDDTPLEGSLHDVVARYNFMDLWPCTSKELDHLARQEWLASNIYKKVEKPKTQFQLDTSEKSPVLGSSSVSARVIYPDTSKMVIYDPRVQGTNASIQMPDDIMKVLPPALASFVANLPAVEGPSPDVNIVISILLQSNIPIGPGSKPTSSAPQFSRIPGPSTSDLSGSSKTHPHQNGALRKGQLGKRKESKDDDTATVQSRPLPADVFKIRHMRKSRGISSASQTGSAASGGSAFSGELSGSTG